MRVLTEKEKLLLKQVDGKKLMEYAENVGKEVRMSGSAEELRAFEYVQKTLESFGLSTELTFFDAYISLPVRAELRIDGVGYACITHSMSSSTQEITAPVVYVGKGAEYQDGDMRGKFALTDGIAMGGALDALQQAGAEGVIFVNADRYVHEMIVSMIWGSPTAHTKGLLPRIPVISVNGEAGEKIKRQLEQKRETIAALRAEVDTGWRKIPCLTATLEGREKDEYVLFSGHIDSWHYGVMDNGTANAVQLETARIFSELSSLEEPPQRTLKFAFWSGHSHGRYAGSATYCDAHFEDLQDNCFLHVNVDSPGGRGAAVLSRSSCMAETRTLAADAVKAVTGQDYKGSRFKHYGDQSFWGTGTPSIFVGVSEQPEGGLGWWWHTTEDLLDKIDPENLKRDASVYLLLLYRALTDDFIPIDNVAAVAEIRQFLEKYRNVAAGRLPLDESVARARKLEAVIKAIYDGAENLKNTNRKKAFNAFTMEMSRLLVPIGYVKGSRFDHDPAWSGSGMPLLEEAEELQNAPRGGDKEAALVTLLRRRINKVDFVLRRGIEISEKFQESGKS